MIEGLARILPADIHDKAGLVVVSDGPRADGSFCLHHIVAAHLRKRHAVVLVSLMQTYFHHKSVGRKLGVDYDTARAEGRLVFIDYLAPGSLASALGGHSGSNRLRGIYRDIEKAVHTLGRASEPVAVVIDDLTPLTFEKVTAHALQSLVRYLGAIARVVALRVHHEEGGDEGHEGNRGAWGVHCRTLYHDATVHVACALLPEGNTRDVHGKLTISELHGRAVEPQCYHYHVQERTVQVAVVA